ncbi:MAG: hybrid sensor histidine kinase/response regulator [Actinomycetota bacterium]
MEQGWSLHDGVPLVSLGNLGGAVCAMLILLNSKELPHGFLYAWFLLFLVHTGASFYRRRQIPRESLADPGQLSRWLRWSVANLGLLGLLWGALFVPLFFLDNTPLQFAALAGSAMLGAGAMASLGAHLPSYRAFLFTLLPPMSVCLLAQGNWLHLGMGLASVMFIMFMLWSGNRFNASYLESLRLRFENLDLVQELTVQKEAAEQAALAKSRFLAAASHDLRQPMYAIHLYHDALDNSPLPGEARQYLDNARQCAAAMDSMFSVLLDMSKLDAGAIQPVVTSFPVAGILDRIRVEFAPAAEEKGLSLRVLNSDGIIQTDRALAEQIIRNLVANAVRYTERGGILVGCRRRGERLQIVVVDTGIGIPAEQQAAVFEEYVQLGNPERDRNKGLGLGLAIVKRLARLLDASLVAKSTFGRGSMFAVEFVRRNTADDLHDNTGSPQLGSLENCLIAVIEDEAMIRDALKTVLEQWGCAVAVAGSGDEAVAALAMGIRIPDAIICDYRLRGEETGLDAIEKLRAEFCTDIPALLVTGDTAPGRMREIRASGLPMLHKPVQPDALQAALLRACNQSRKMAETA